jgi:hypothetical protein
MPNVANMIALPDDLQALAEERVCAGEYANVGEVALEAFGLLQLRDEQRQAVRVDFAGLFGEMESGAQLEPSDGEFEEAVQARAAALRGMTRARIHPRVYDDIEEALTDTSDRLDPLEAAPTADAITARMVGIGMMFAAKAESDADIESTLLHASVLGMVEGDLRVLAVLTTWLGVHHAHVNADGLVRLVGAHPSERVRAYWAAVAMWLKKDRRLARLVGESEAARDQRQLLLQVVLPHQSLLPRCVTEITPGGVSQFIAPLAGVGVASVMLGVKTSLIAAARRQTLTRR